MIEELLINIGMKCGTVKNFNTTIMDDVRMNAYQHWYFLTPVKVKPDKSNLREATVNLAYPFLANDGEIDEEKVYSRLSETLFEYEKNLLKELRKHDLIVIVNTDSLIPFWSGKAEPRDERKNFASTQVHIFNANLTIKYRN